MFNEMTPELIGAIGGILVIFGGGVRYLMNRIDKKEARLKQTEASERKKLETLMQKQIDLLREDNKVLRLEVARYVRHVGVLEGILRHANIDVPNISI